MISSEIETGSAKVRSEKILEVIMSYARLDFGEKTIISDKGDVYDAIGAGVNMLGEELKNSVVSLREKEQLLREIHHRVKNNMQIISSLLNLQTHNVKDKDFLALITESRNRINSMALVHEMLYATTDFSKISLKDYTTTLCNSIYQSYRKPDMKINFVVNIPSNVSLEIDIMVHLGMILNEIVSNSLKYAFDNNEGIISVLLEQKDSRHFLSIEDNGKGLPKGFNREKDGNLGMQLIYMLTEQLNGTVQMESTGRTIYTIEF
ncbi:MAG TPA: sensor histidine kinase [Bacteroidia bacterium]|jgi:two-component sensor histidine kinase|nr:sensor histidine kinase [Bacteroidia bacterium]